MRKPKQADTPRTGVGARLRMVRLEANTTQSQFADVLGVHLRTYVNYEHGEFGMYSDSIIRLYGQFGVDPSWLLLGIKAPKYPADFQSLAVFAADLNQLLTDLGDAAQPSERAAIIDRWLTR